MAGWFTLFIPSFVISFFLLVFLFFHPFLSLSLPTNKAAASTKGESDEKERQGYFNENSTRLWRHLVPSATSNERQCKYYFCLCTCQLRMTLTLINNAKQSDRAASMDSPRFSFSSSLFFFRAFFSFTFFMSD